MPVELQAEQLTGKFCFIQGGALELHRHSHDPVSCGDSSSIGSIRGRDKTIPTEPKFPLPASSRRRFMAVSFVEARAIAIKEKGGMGWGGERERERERF